MKKLLHAFWVCCVFFCLPTAILHAQTTCITGTVVDSTTGSAIPGVVLRIQEQNMGTTTNALGQFTLCNVSNADQTLVIHAIGYEQKNISVNAAHSAKYTIPLRAKTIELQEVNIESNDLSHSMSAINQLDRQLRPTNSAQDLLTLVPGLFIAQHAGGGKAEQIFLRGFDCDHGTDFFVSVDGIPVNMVSHAHGQGYADFHFVIPETVDKLNAVKGPYSARFGDFTTAGAGEFTTKNAIDRTQFKFGYGEFNTWRGLAMIDLLGDKHLFTNNTEHAYIAAEYNYSDAYFDKPQHFNRVNVFGKYTGLINDKNFLSFSASTFSSRWDASGQIPERAVQQGLISRFGSISNSEGGSTKRSNVNLALTTDLGNNRLIKNQVYYSYYEFTLFSDFTFFLNDSIHGDEIKQRENGRSVFGYNGSYERSDLLFGKKINTTIGLGTRGDAGAMGLQHAQNRIVRDTIVSGKLYQQSVFGWLDETMDLNEFWKINAAVRLDYFFFQFTDDRDVVRTGQAQKARVSPKLNITYSPNTRVQFFARSGFGFHSNDARAVVQGLAGTSLPRALGYEVGSIFKPVQNIVVHAAVWGLNIENELVYVGDEGVVEINGATQRYGLDLAARWEILPWLLADADFNYNHGRFVDLPEGENFIPLAPAITATGGLTLRQEKGFSAAIRFRHVGDRPANENNTVTAKGFFITDALINYTQKHYVLGLSAENIFNQTWNQAQFDTESRLQGEDAPVSELHFTPGTPLFIKGSITVLF